MVMAGHEKFGSGLLLTKMKCMWTCKEKNAQGERERVAAVVGQ